MNTLGAGAIQFHFMDGSKPISVRSPLLKEIVIPSLNPSFVREIGFSGGDQTSMIVGLDNGSDLVRGVSPLRLSNASEPVGAVITDYYIPTSLSGRLFGITSAFGDYQEVRRMKGPIKTTYVLILLMVALLVIFIGFWFGLSMARRRN